MHSTEAVETKPKKNIVQSISKFLVLFFWVMPIRREKDRTLATDIGIGYGILVLCAGLYAFASKPYIPAANFPELSQLPVVEGILVRHPTERDSRYSNEPLGIDTLAGVVFKKCNALGNRCFVADTPPSVWQNHAGQSVRVWYLGDWIVQLELNGRIPDSLSYEQRKRQMTGIPGALLWSLPILGYLLFRLFSRYGRAAYDEAFSVTDKSTVQKDEKTS